MTFPMAPIGTVARVQSGYAFKSSQWTNTGIPVIRIGNVRQGWLDIADTAFVPQNALRDHVEFLLRRDDLVITMTGEIGDRALVRTDQPLMLNQRVGRFSVTEPAKLHKIYLYYALGLPEARTTLRLVAHGVAQPNISPSAIHQCQIPLPPLPIQRRIASILGAYDDLIEVNRRRIAVLEEMARRLFDEWFVHFRFPGHEGHRMVETEHGRLPEGWEWSRLDGMLVLQRGFDLPSAERRFGPYPIVTGSGIGGFHAEARVKAPGVVTRRSGTIGNVFLVHNAFWPLNTALYVKEFRRSSPVHALQGCSTL